MINVIFLGTSSQFPTKDRNHSSIFLRYNRFKCLFDCGEGTQRQMRILKLSPHKINALFITHWHGDHTLGIGGIIQSLSATNREESLKVYGPIGTKDRINYILNTYIFKKTFNLEVFELNVKGKELFLETDDFKLFAFPLNHGIPTIGYSFETKPKRRINIDYTKKFGLIKDPLLGKLQNGEDIVYNGKRISVDKATYLESVKKITYIADTKYFNKLIDYAKNSDLLISEATFAKKHEDKCSDYNHMSSRQAAIIAKESDSKKLIMTHLSQRYNDDSLLINEAKEIFKNSDYAKDFNKINV